MCSKVGTFGHPIPSVAAASYVISSLPLLPWYLARRDGARACRRRLPARGDQRSGARAFSAQDARGTSIKLIFYETLLENTVEFECAFAALQTHTKKNMLSMIYSKLHQIASAYSGDDSYMYGRSRLKLVRVSESTCCNVLADRSYYIY